MKHIDTSGLDATEVLKVRETFNKHQEMSVKNDFFSFQYGREVADLEQNSKQPIWRDMPPDWDGTLIR